MTKDIIDQVLRDNSDSNEVRRVFSFSSYQNSFLFLDFSHRVQDGNESNSRSTSSSRQHRHAGIDSSLQRDAVGELEDDDERHTALRHVSQVDRRRRFRGKRRRGEGRIIQLSGRRQSLEIVENSSQRSRRFSDSRSHDGGSGRLARREVSCKIQRQTRLGISLYM